MFGLKRTSPVAEYEADGEIARVYHEIRQILRVSGVNLNFRTWAIFDGFLPAMWNAMRPNVETRAFEDASDDVRSEAARLAAGWPRLEANGAVRLGGSQRYQIEAALDLYHYINPKLLVLTSAVRLALEGERVGGGEGASSERLPRGEPEKMFPMEMESDDPDDERLRRLFEDIKETLELPSVNSDYRTLALWPDYLEAVWDRLKPRIGTSDYEGAAVRLRDRSRQLARELPCPVTFGRDQVADLGEDVEAVLAKTRSFEKLLPELILNIALILLDWREAERAVESPFPVGPKPGAKEDRS